MSWVRASLMRSKHSPGNAPKRDGDAGTGIASLLIHTDERTDAQGWSVADTGETEMMNVMRDIDPIVAQSPTALSL